MGRASGGSNTLHWIRNNIIICHIILSYVINSSSVLGDYFLKGEFLW